ncbi:MAG: D-aminoacyl-tRNA deacylase [Polyangiaceae bacterium]
MRAVVQRVTAARVEVAGEIVGQIEKGLVAFIGIGKGDGEAEARYLADKIVEMRVFEDDAGKMNRALADVSGGLLLVSQFTLYGDTSRGRRPGFDRAMPPAEAEKLYDHFVTLVRARYSPVATGRFRADMRVLVDNDGPVTLLLETPLAASP